MEKMRKALTLVEAIIYLGILGSILFPLSFGLFRFYFNFRILKNYQQINQIATFFVLKLEREIKNAKEILFPEISQKSLKLSLVDSEGSQVNIFFEEGKVIFEKNGKREEIFFKSFPFSTLSFLNLEGRGVKVEFEIGFEERGKFSNKFFSSTFTLLPKNP